MCICVFCVAQIEAMKEKKQRLREHLDVLEGKRSEKKKPKKSSSEDGEEKGLCFLEWWAVEIFYLPAAAVRRIGLSHHCFPLLLHF